MAFVASRVTGDRECTRAMFASDIRTAANPPSEADMRLTRRLAEGARILQINMLDHVIVGKPFDGGPGYFSFKEAGAI